MANTSPIFPVTPTIQIASLIAATAAVSRAPVASASLGGTPSYAIQIGGVAGASGRRIDRIQVKSAQGTNLTGITTACTVIIWYDDLTTGYPIAEILCPAVSPTTAVASLDVSQTFANLILPAGTKLWASTTIVGAAAAHALVVYAYGGDY